MEQQVGVVQFLERGAERAHQFLGQIPDEPDCIGHDRFPLLRKAQARLAVSSVSKRRLFAVTRLRVRTFSSVDLPALV